MKFFYVLLVLVVGSLKCQNCDTNCKVCQVGVSESSECKECNNGLYPNGINCEGCQVLRCNQCESSSSTRCGSCQLFYKPVDGNTKCSLNLWIILPIFFAVLLIGFCIFVGICVKINKRKTAKDGYKTSEVSKFRQLK